MLGFQYIRPATVAEVCALLQEHGDGARLLAGGTDLLVRMRNGRAAPRVVIDLKRVRDLPKGITAGHSALWVGSLTTMAEVATDPRVWEHFPALTQAAALVGSLQIRHRATLVGNICNASPAADTAPPLLVYGARVHITGPAGDRAVPVAEFFTGPGRTVLGAGELVRSLELPLPTERQGGAFARLSRRKGVDLATASVACLVRAGGTARVAFGAVGPTPILVDDESGLLATPVPDAARWSEVIDRLVATARPISDMRASRDYRMAMLPVYTRRALTEAHRRLYLERGATE